MAWWIIFKIKGDPLKDKYYVAKIEGKVGMGGYVFDDCNGILERTGFLYAYTYHIS